MYRRKLWLKLEPKWQDGETFTLTPCVTCNNLTSDGAIPSISCVARRSVPHTCRDGPITAPPGGGTDLTGGATRDALESSRALRDGRPF